MRDLQARGVGIIFVTHFLEQVYEVSNRITVLRNGELVGEYPVSELPQVELVARMMGKNLNDLADLEEIGQKKENVGNIVYEAENLSSSECKPFNFQIREGEVNGFTGLLGSGRSESVRAIFGADRVTGGKVKVKGKSVHISKPHEAMKAGIGYLSEDRKRDGIIADLSVRENIILAMQVMKGFFHPMGRKEMEKFADEYIRTLKIKTAGQETPVGSLSGGNQQKVILARWLLTHPDYLILDEPTRGIDVGTKLEIQKLVLKLAAEENMSITFISSEIEEMLRTCSRLIVMRDRNIVGELTGDDLNQASVMQTIAGGGR
jgi:simple sugar transport system ATP-binding protein